LVIYFAAAREHVIPQLKTLTLAQIEVSAGAEVALQELSSCGKIQIVERLSEQLEV
jgi:hypothetical protein